MDLWQLLILSVAGVLGGVLAGLFGVGGGGVFVPALVYGAGWEIKDAVAASLFIITFSALSGTIRSIRSETPANWKVAALFACTVAPSVLVGIAINRFSPELVTELVFACFLLTLAYPTATRSHPRRQEGIGASGEHPALATLAGFGVGTLSGLIGVGGAAMMVPLMILGFGVTPKTAMSTSLAVTIFIGLVGSAGYLATGFDRISGLPPLIIGSIIGAWLGVRARELLSDLILQRAFAAFMVLVALRVLADAANIL